MRLMTCLAVIAFGLAVSHTASADCREVWGGGFGEKKVQCDDGNQYSIKENWKGETEIEGYNPNTGAQWKQRFGEDYRGEYMEGTDQYGRDYECTMNSWSNKWDCN